MKGSEIYSRQSIFNTKFLSFFTLLVMVLSYNIDKIYTKVCYKIYANKEYSEAGHRDTHLLITGTQEAKAESSLKPASAI